MWVEVVVGSRLASGCLASGSGCLARLASGCLALLLALLFSGFSVVLPSVKPISSNSNSTAIEDPHGNQLRLMWIPLSVL